MAEPTVTSFTCKYCGRPFNMKPHLIRHINAMHGEEPEVKARVAARPAAETPKRPVGRPRKDGSPAQPRKGGTKRTQRRDASTNSIGPAEAIKELKAELEQLRAFKQAVEESLNG